MILNLFWFFMHYDENESLGDVMARIIKFAFVLLIIIFMYCCFEYFKHKKQLASMSKTECGKLSDYFRKDEGPGKKTYVSYILVNINGVDKKFVSQVDLSKSYTKQGKNILEVSKKIKIGDELCVTYSLEYWENITDKVLEQKIPYLINLNFK